MGWAETLDKCKDPSDYAFCTCVMYSCGYSQPHRNWLTLERLKKGTAETDCSYGVNWWLMMGGFLNEVVAFNTRNMREYLRAHGFVMFRYGELPLKRNDVLWRTGHTGLYIGEGLQAEAIMDENGQAGYEGTIPGDQIDGETRVCKLTHWEYVLRKFDPPILKGSFGMTFLFTCDGEHSGKVFFYDGGKCWHVSGHEKDAITNTFKKVTGDDIPFVHIEGGSHIVNMCARA